MGGWIQRGLFKGPFFRRFLIIFKLPKFDVKFFAFHRNKLKKQNQKEMINEIYPNKLIYFKFKIFVIYFYFYLLSYLFLFIII
jgi:hypothetical protein